MIKRRKFLKVGSVSAALLALGANPIKAKKKKKVKKKAKKKARARSLKLMLKELTGEEAFPYQAGYGPVAGWAVAVPTANRGLAVMIHLDTAEPSADHEVKVLVAGEWHEDDIQWIYTDEIGDGTELAVLHIPDYPRQRQVQVQIGVQGPKKGYATATITVLTRTNAKKKKKKAS